MLMESALSRRFDDALNHGTSFSAKRGRGIMHKLENSAKRTPAHLWIIGAISLLWNSFGCLDYTMTKLDPEGYMKSVGMGDAEIAYTQALPMWISAFWAVGVWASLAGAVLLLMRSRHAVTAFAVSLIGLAVSQGYQFADSTIPDSMYSGAMLIITAVIWASLLFLLWYANRMKAAGVLR